MSLSQYFSFITGLLFIFVISLIFIGDADIYTLAYITVFICAAARAIATPGKRRLKISLVTAYSLILASQIMLLDIAVFVEDAPNGHAPFIRRAFGAAILLLPMMVSRYVSVSKYARFYLPSVEETATIGLSELVNAVEKLKHAAGAINHARKNLSPENIKAVVDDLPRHDSFRYINNGSLTDEYFQKATESLPDPNIYIVISKTGSAASDIISVFTQKQYNHASLSFDNALQTIISYNGGERVYPPGLNMEMLEFFSKKPGAGILIYRLPCPPEKKKRILDKIAAINREGSAYNMLGLVLKRSYRPNIMFCSQFVYKVLDDAGLSYFAKPNGKVSPTDLVELDYYRKLKFEKEIKFL